MLAVLTKLFLVILLWYILTETRANKKLNFYKAGGVPTIKQVSIIFCLDTIITIGFLLIIKVYI